MKSISKVLIAAGILLVIIVIINKINPSEKYEPRTFPVEHEVTYEHEIVVTKLPARKIAKESKEEPLPLPPAAGSKAPYWVKILNYHEIFPESVRSSRDPKVNRFSKPSDLMLIVSLENFEKQMKYLSENYKCVKMSDFGEHMEKKEPYDRNVVVITFDGADETIYKNAYPVLKKYNLPATLFLHINSVKLDKTAMSWETIKKINDEGLMEVESHSMTHPHLNKKKTDESEEEYEKRIKWEFTESKRIIEEKLSKKVYYFAYPYGSYDATVMRLLKESGYKASVTVQWDKNTVESNPFALKRRGVFGNIDIRQFSELFIKNYKDDIREFAD